MLARVQAWHTNYTQGEVYASRMYLSTKFEKQDIPVLYAHDVPWRQDELEHLVRILTAVKPKWTITIDFERILAMVRNRSKWKKNEEMVKFRDGFFIVTSVFEEPDLKELCLTLKEVRDGRRDTNEELLANQKKAGKEIWQM
jgi:hypothetical protein